MKWILIAILGCSLTATGQTAKVIQLSPEEAKQAKALRDQQDTIAKKIADFDQAIRIKYLTAPKDDEGHTQTYSLNGKWIWVRNGWGSGSFQYSEDFRFIIPSVTSTNGILNCGLGCGSNWITTTPSIGCFTN